MLFKKMIRDLWKNKVQFGAIFIMMFLGVFIFSGISSEYHGLEVALNNYIKENNLADAWLYQKEFSDSTLNELKKQTDYEQRMYVSTSNKAVDNSILISILLIVIKFQLLKSLMVNHLIIKMMVSGLMQCMLRKMVIG